MRLGSAAHWTVAVLSVLFGGLCVLETGPTAHREPASLARCRAADLAAVADREAKRTPDDDALLRATRQLGLGVKPGLATALATDPDKTINLIFTFSGGSTLEWNDALLKRSVDCHHLPMALHGRSWRYRPSTVLPFARRQPSGHILGARLRRRSHQLGVQGPPPPPPPPPPPRPPQHPAPDQLYAPRRVPTSAGLRSRSSRPMSGTRNRRTPRPSRSRSPCGASCPTFRRAVRAGPSRSTS